MAVLVRKVTIGLLEGKNTFLASQTTWNKIFDYTVTIYWKKLHNVCTFFSIKYLILK